MTTTDKKASATDWANVPFIDYLNQVDDLLETQYGITSDDCDVARIADCQEAGDTPEQCVLWIAEKYNLTPLPAATGRTRRIAALNDLFRSQIGLPAFNPPVQGQACYTAGIAALTPEQIVTIMARVRQFDDFTEDNDPPGEHDFGAFDLPDVGKIFWKIDYYDEDEIYGSEDPANPEITTRVLTIMLADEY